MANPVRSLIVVLTAAVASAQDVRAEHRTDDRPFDDLLDVALIDLNQPVDTIALADGDPGDQPPTEPDATANANANTGDPFAKGSWTFQTYGSALFGDKDKGEMYAGHIGVGYFLEDDISVNLDAFGAYVRSGIDDNGGAGGADLLFRGHFLKGEADDWSIYVDGGVGFQQATTNFSGSRHFNFRLSFGFGGTVKLGDRLNLMGGARYLHISDAGIEGGGGGFDGPWVYTGIQVPF